MKLTEADIARTCKDFLELDGWRPIKMEPISRREWGRGTGELGQPDYLFLRYATNDEDWGDVYTGPMGAPYVTNYNYDEILWIEFKRRGGKAKAHQKAWQAAERARGALVWSFGTDIIPATIEAFQEHYRASGLMRRKI
jgi:hypothetical protein